MISGCKKLKLPSYNYLMIIKPIIAGIIPKKFLMKYHRKNLKLKTRIIKDKEWKIMVILLGNLFIVYILSFVQD